VAIISGNLLNEHLPIVIVVPLATKIKNYKGNPILTPNKVNGLKTESEMLTFHVQSISKDRLVRKIGIIDTADLNLSMKTLNDILKY
jgi:mRNA interferase MazF